MNNIFLLILSALVIGVVFIFLFLDIGLIIYDRVITKKAKKYLKKRWKDCSTCEHNDCFVRTDSKDAGCDDGECYEALKHLK